MNTFIVKYVKKIVKNMKKINNNQIIQLLVNEIFIPFGIFSARETSHFFRTDKSQTKDFCKDAKRTKSISGRCNSHNKRNKKDKNNKRSNKYNELIHKLHTTENEKNILQDKVIILINEMKQLSNKNQKLEIENEHLNQENEELKEQLKNRNFKSKKTFTLIPYY